MLKDEAGRANVGRYLVADPLGGVLVAPTLWGRTLIVSNCMGAGSFLAGDSMQAEIWDRLEANIAISTEHSDYFIKNLVAIRAEERLALAVYRSSAFVYRNF